MRLLMQPYTTMPTTKGFTLIETIVVMIITAVVLTMAAILLNAGLRNYFISVEVTELASEASIAMAKISKEIVQAKSFSAINASNVTFVTTGGSTISYSWTSPTLTRTGSGANTLSNQVTSFALTYYQSNFTTTATASLVDAVTISMTLNDGNETIPLVNTVFLNNMK